MHTDPSKLLRIVAGTLLLFSCNHDRNHFHAITSESGEVTAVHPAAKDTQHAGLKSQSVIRLAIKKEIACSGTLEAAPENRRVVSSVASGTIKTILHFANEYVKAGTVIATLENIDFITIQKDYLEAGNQLEYMHEEYTRQGELTVENATSLKNMQIARRDYQLAELKYKALRKQIQMLGLVPDSIHVDHLVAVIPVRAPCSGYLSGSNISSGLYVEKGTVLFEIQDRHNFMVMMQIPEESALAMEPGLDVHFWIAPDSLQVFTTRVQTICPVADQVHHTIHVIAKFNHPSDKIIPGLSVKARIETIHDTASFIPSSAVTCDGKNCCVFAAKKGYYYKIPVKTGLVKDNLIELIAFPREWSDSVITDGTKYLNSWFK